MYRPTLILLVLLTAVASISCTPAPFSKQQPVATKPKLPTIVTVTGRHESLTISAAPGAPRYSVADKTGCVLLSDATAPELARQQPHLHRLLDANASADSQLIADLDR